MAESYSVRAILSAKDSGFSSTLNKCVGALDKIDSKISGFSFGVLTGAGQAAFNTLKNGVSDLIGEINSSNKAWKTFEGNMKILNKTDKEISAVKGTLQDYATQTIYSASDMASSYSQLSAVGIKSADKLVTGFGGLAAAAEDPAQAMKTLSQQGVQMAAKPNVAWQDFKLMLEQTPAGMAAVAKQMGMTTSELVTAIQDGEVSTKSFFKAVEAVGNSNGFKKMATEYKSVDQAMDGLKETVSNKIQPAFEVLSQKGISAVSKVIDVLGKLDGQKIADKVSAMYDKIVAGAQTIATKAKPYINAFKEAFAGIKGPVLNAFYAIQGNLGKLSKKFGSAESVGGFKAAMESVADVITKVANFCTKHSVAIAKFIEYLPAIVIGLKGFKIAKTVAPGLFSFATGLGKMVASGIGGLASKLFGVSKGTTETGQAAAASAKQLLAAGAAFLMIGAGVMLAAIGFALLAQSAIALSAAGGLAIGVFVGMAVGVAGLLIGMMLLLKSMASTSATVLPAAAALLLVGAAVLLVGVGFALMAQSAIALAAAGGGAIAIMFGLVAVMALLAVGAALLGTALTAGAVGFLAFGAAIILCGVGAILAAAGLAIITALLPTLATYGLQGALAITALAGSILLFGVSAAVAAIPILAVGASLLVVGAALLIVGTGLLLAGTGFMLIATYGLLAAVWLMPLLSLLPQIVKQSILGAPALLALGAALTVFGVGALTAGTGLLILGAGLAAAAGGMMLLSMVLPLVTANAQENAIALALLAAGLTAFGIAAGIAAIPTAALGIAITVLGAAILVLSLGAMAAAGAISLIGLALPLLSANAAQGSVALLMVGASMTVFAVGAGIAGAACIVLAAGVLAFGAAILVAAAGTLVMAAAIKMVSSSMKTIAKNAKSTEKSLKTMQKSIKVVESGLNALGSKAKAAMNKLTSAFTNTAGKVTAAGMLVGTGFTNGMKAGLSIAPSMAKAAISTVIASLRSGQNAAFMAGAFISQGFANGMLSCLWLVESAAERLAAAADKAVRAKAKIHSPSRVSDKLGYYWASGYIDRIKAMSKDAWDAAKQLVQIPQVATPDLAMAYAGEMSADYDYFRQAEYTIEVPLAVDGKEFAKATVKYNQDELDRRAKREERKRGKA